MKEDISGYAELKAQIMQLSGVNEASHRFGGTEFQVDGVEFMHSHGPSWFDIRLSKEDQASVLKSGEALPHRFAPQAGWVSMRVSKSSDLAIAQRIIQLAYENAQKNLEEIRTRRAMSETQA